MSTEIFQWAVVILLALIWITSISTRGLNEHLWKLRSHLEQIEMLMQDIRGLREKVHSISMDVEDIRERVHDNFWTNKEREIMESNRNPFA